MRNSHKKKNILYALLVLFLVIVVVGLGYILYIAINNYNAAADYNSVRETAQPSTQSANIAEKNAGTADNPIDFNSLSEINDEIYAWIYVPGTNIDYPVLQSRSDDFFYLDHDVYKNYLFAGSIYSEVCNLRDFSDRNTVLYGHNMADGSMFATLHRFEDKDFFDENRYIYIYQPGRKITYEIVSAYNYDERHIMNSFNFADDSVFQSYIESVMKPHAVGANVYDDIQLDLGSKLITLSTCLNGYEEGRYLVQGVMIKDEPTA